MPPATPLVAAATLSHRRLAATYAKTCEAPCCAQEVYACSHHCIVRLCNLHLDPSCRYASPTVQDEILEVFGRFSRRDIWRRRLWSTCYPFADAIADVRNPCALILGEESNLGKERNDEE